MFHAIRLNRHSRIIRSLLLLMLVAWWPSLLQACCDVGAGDTGSAHCPFCPAAEHTQGHDRYAGNACDFEPCPAMEAASHDRLTDQARIIAEKPSIPNVPLTVRGLCDPFAAPGRRNTDHSLVALGPPLIYQYCTLLN